MNDKIGQTKNLTGKYIMELLKINHLQHYTTTFELDYIKLKGSHRDTNSLIHFCLQWKNYLKP